MSTEGEELKAAAVDPLLVTIGDIAVSQHWVVTPSGTTPIGGTTWAIDDLSYTKLKHPAWTIVLAVLLFPIGPLFLFVKKDEMYGMVEVKVTGPQFVHAAHVPARNQMNVTTLRQNVNRAQSIAATAV
jgi:hypothetical protein